MFGAVPDGGWFGYANLTSAQFSPRHSIDFWMLGLQKYGDGQGGAPRPKPAPVTAAELAAIHMPPASFWPIVLAIAMAVMISGLLIGMYQIIVGGLLTLYCMYKFAMELHRPAEGHGH